jgi:RelB Antitoxin alpha helical domain
MNAQARDYPFAQEFITDAEGQIRKVVLDIADYRRLIEAIEDEGLYRAMAEARHEKPLSLEEARKEIEKQFKRIRRS